jgi:hypothetical protein
MVTKFYDYIKGFRSSSAADASCKPPTPQPAVNGDSEAKRRQLRGQIAGALQELLNSPELSDADRRLLIISSAVAFLLSGGR